MVSKVQPLGLEFDPTGDTGAARGNLSNVVPPTGRVSLNVHFASPEDFGAVGNGTTDDTAAIQAAADSLSSGGGRVLIPNTMRCLVDSNLSLPPNVALVGPHKYMGSPQDNTSAPYGSVGGALIVNPAATVALEGGASVSGLLVHRKGMTFPSSDASAFAGTAFTANGDDTGVISCMILGFAQAFRSVGFQRPRFTNNSFDCVSGVYVEDCLDNPCVRENHGWPFATIATVSKPANWADRAGAAYHFKNTADWLTTSTCMSYGYLRGHKVENVNHYCLIAPMADGTGAYANSVGIEVDGTAGGCEDGQIIGHRVAAQGHAAILINTLNGIPTRVIGGAEWDCGTHGIRLVNGDLHVDGSLFRDTPNGITIDSADSRVFRSGVRFDSVTVPINVTVSNPYIYGTGDDNSLAPGNSIAGANMVTQTIASADPLNLPSTGDAFNVSGTTSFGGLNGGWKDRVVTLYFAGALSAFSSTGAVNAMRLNGGATFTSTAGSTLTLRHNGVQWYEVGRSI